jgi:hypothetical protein
MAKATKRRQPVTSDPDHGIAVNSGTDPQRPGTPARPRPDSTPPGTSAAETSAPTDRFDATHKPAARSGAGDVEGSGTKGDPDDAL